MSENGRDQNGNSSNYPEDSEKKYFRAPKELIRQRRALVEEMLLLPARAREIHNALKDRFSCDYESIRRDIKVINRYWRSEEIKNGSRRKEEALRRYIRKMRKTEAEGNWVANIALEALYAKVCGFIQGDTIRLGDKNINFITKIEDHSRIVKVLDRLSLDERKRLAQSMALARRGFPVGAGTLPGIPQQLGRSVPSGIEPGGTKDTSSGSD